MKCQEVNKLLIAYLDNEVTPSERTLIRAHLAGCERCQEELAALSALQSRVSQFLQVRAAQATPSPQAWSRLQARLAGEARPSLSWLPAWLQRLAPGVGRINQIFERGVTMKKGFALTAIAALVLALSVMAFVPSVRAQVGGILNTWFHFESPDGEYEMTLVSSIPMEFAPLHPTYLPAGLQSAGVGVGGEFGVDEPKIELTYRSADQFVVITQTKAPADRTLPAGEETTVNGQPAVLVTGLEGTFGDDFGIPEGSQPEDSQGETFDTPPADCPCHTIAYTDGKRLTWYVGDVKVEMLSNLSVEEMLKIGASLVPAEAGEGDLPFQLPPDLPSGSEGEPVGGSSGSIESKP